MENQNYKKQHILLIALDVLIIILGLGNVVWQFFVNFTSLSAASAENFTSYPVTLLMYCWIMLYAFWGYKHSIVPFRIGLTCYLMGLMISMTRILDAYENGTIDFRVTLLGFILVALVTFDNTFKKHKIAAVISGSVLTILELIRGIMTLVNAIGTADGDMSKILAAQPFSYFFAAASILVTYIIRCHWSANGKIDILDE